jgi:nicotinamidase-related amidase
VRDVNALVIVGVSTNNSVEASARSAGNLGFATVVVADATYTFAMRDYAGVERSADEVHAMALANLMSDYAAIEDTQGILAQLERA